MQAGKLIAKKEGKPLVLLYLPKGTLIWASNAVDEPSKTDQTHGKEILRQAKKKQCIVELAKFQAGKGAKH